MRGGRRRPRHVVVFARAPQRGAIKRRLARGIGDGPAHRFYVENTRNLVARLARDHRWRVVLAVTPDGFARRARFWPARVARLPQGWGDLGARMAHVFATLPPGPAVIVGSDIPGVTASLIARAFAALGTHRAVFGPAADGGYWLVGLARREAAPGPFARGLFRGVRWSTPHALADTRANLPVGAEAPPLPVLEDVDDAAAYLRFRRAAR